MFDLTTTLAYGTAVMEMDYARDPLPQELTGAGSPQPDLVLMSERFGEIRYPVEAVLSFTCGLVGFEEIRQFIVVDINGCEPFQWLISLDQPTLGFPMIQASHLDEGYTQALIQEADVIYGISPKDVMVYAIITLPEDLRASTVNFRAPVLIDSRRRQGQQIILVTDDYSTEHPLIASCSEIARDESC